MKDQKNVKSLKAPREFHVKNISSGVVEKVFATKSEAANFLAPIENAENIYELSVAYIKKFRSVTKTHRSLRIG